MGKLSALRVKSAGAGRHADGDGLYLLVKESGARSWLLRMQSDGKRRDLGLGSVDTSMRSKEAAQAAEAVPILKRRLLTLAEAREKAEAYRKLIRSGLDPVAERKRVPVVIPTFERAARDCHDQLKAGWRNRRHSDSWLTCLVTYVFPKFGDKPVDQIDSIMVRDMLTPIWIKIPETARRVLQRVGAVLDFAHINGWRPSETSLKSVRKGLPRQPKVEGHFEAMLFADVPAFFQKVTAEEATVGRDALAFTILNAVRSNETRFAVWSEIDMKKAVWTIPAGRMKMNAEHVVPLSETAMAILTRRWEMRDSDDGFVFFSKPDKAISDMTMTKVLRDADIAGITVHGFRSTFTDWAAEMTEHRKEVVDKALAHKLPDKVEAAYRRTDFFEKRRALMDDWATYLTTPQAAASA